mgnify:CR=1 FL=1
MGGPVVTIRNLINHSTLRPKDKVLALKYLNDGDIDLLKDLVDSAYVLSKKAKDNSEIPEEFKDIDMNNLNDLKIEVNDYYLFLGYNPNSNEDYCDDITSVLHYDDIADSDNDEQFFI